MLWHEPATTIIGAYEFAFDLRLDTGYGYFKEKRKQRRHR